MSSSQRQEEEALPAPFIGSTSKEEPPAAHQTSRWRRLARLPFFQWAERSADNDSKNTLSLAGRVDNDARRRRPPKASAVHAAATPEQLAVEARLRKLGADLLGLASKTHGQGRGLTNEQRTAEASIQQALAPLSTAELFLALPPSPPSLAGDASAATTATSITPSPPQGLAVKKLVIMRGTSLEALAALPTFQHSPLDSTPSSCGGGALRHGRRRRWTVVRRAVQQPLNSLAGMLSPARFLGGGEKKKLQNRSVEIEERGAKGGGKTLRKTLENEEKGTPVNRNTPLETSRLNSDVASTTMPTAATDQNNQTEGGSNRIDGEESSRERGGRGKGEQGGGAGRRRWGFLSGTATDKTAPSSSPSSSSSSSSPSHTMSAARAAAGLASGVSSTGSVASTTSTTTTTTTTSSGSSSSSSSSSTASKSSSHSAVGTAQRLVGSQLRDALALHLSPWREALRACSGGSGGGGSGGGGGGGLATTAVQGGVLLERLTASSADAPSGENGGGGDVAKRAVDGLERFLVGNASGAESGQPMKERDRKRDWRKRRRTQRKRKEEQYELLAAEASKERCRRLVHCSVLASMASYNSPAAPAGAAAVVVTSAEVGTATEMQMRRALGLEDSAPLRVHTVTSRKAKVVVAVSPTRDAVVVSFRCTVDALSLLTAPRPWNAMTEGDCSESGDDDDDDSDDESSSKNRTSPSRSIFSLWRSPRRRAAAAAAAPALIELDPMMTPFTPRHACLSSVPSRQSRGGGGDDDDDASTTTTAAAVAVATARTIDLSAGAGAAFSAPNHEAKPNHVAAMHVHASALEAFFSVERDLNRLLDGHLEHKHVLFTGHGGGGALAQIAAAYYPPPSSLSPDEAADTAQQKAAAPGTFSTSSSAVPPHDGGDGGGGGSGGGGGVRWSVVTVAAPAVGDAAFATRLTNLAAPFGGLHLRTQGDVVPSLGAALGLVSGGLHAVLPSHVVSTQAASPASAQTNGGILLRANEANNTEGAAVSSTGKKQLKGQRCLFDSVASHVFVDLGPVVYSFEEL